MAADLDAIAERLRRALPDARVEVAAWRGDDHLKARVISPAFAGKSRVQRHRMVHAALGELMREEIHALRLITLTPEEARKEDEA